MRELFYIALALWHARRIQDFLWGKPGEPTEGSTANQSWEMWLATIGKRINCLYDIDKKNPSWRVESRKRALQLAGVSIAFICALNTGRISPAPTVKKQYD